MLAGVLATGVAAEERVLTVASSNPFSFPQALQAGPGGDLQVNGAVSLPHGASVNAPVGAVLFVHGAGGPQRFHQDWRAVFRAAGFATAHANHFTPRGGGSAVGDHIDLTGAAMATDALNILSALAALPEIDADKIVIAGTSKGGGVALYTAWAPLVRAISGETQFAAHLAIYPTCMHWDVANHTGAPIRVIVGTQDDWTGHDQCVAAMAHLAGQGVPATTLSLQGAAHGFDSRRPLHKVTQAFDVRACRFSMDVEGVEYANAQPMNAPKAKRAALGTCVKRGAHYGGDTGATKIARDHVRALLATIAAR
ncbi:hypothetical protein ACMU_06825 [Actibacterium mucosum KCTC 23349]|uniref:Dienelactone hydrolase domain-containing protein n=2 Tax=Actibacterium TaxID=1433986 RepID=A0A037ZP97_9RHOB|nr:hypothetical protein ACMU_06825 [Actibacterium mucosum KCTC 23349]